MDEDSGPSPLTVRKKIIKSIDLVGFKLYSHGMSTATTQAVHSSDEMLAGARDQIERVEPYELESCVASGALVVDIRPERQRKIEGDLRFAVVVERNVLEWRFDLLGGHALPEILGYDQQIVVVCSEGYASSLAAASLRALGYGRVSDLAGGYRAWREWRGEFVRSCPPLSLGRARYGSYLRRVGRPVSAMAQAGV
jgi:rhodanese-related sulfurtransferase